MADEHVAWEKIALIVFVAGCVIVLLVLVAMVALKQLTFD